MSVQNEQWQNFPHYQKNWVFVCWYPYITNKDELYSYKKYWNIQNDWKVKAMTKTNR
jgi:hypothetical protein